MNLLVDPLLRVQTRHGLAHMSLPALLAALGRDEVEHLPGLQRHQEDAFHVFLCSLAGVILSRRGDDDPVQTEEYWRAGLRGLAGEAGDDAWTLVVADPSRPAFMQPPIPKTDHGRLKPLAWTPDSLDLLPTAKNHDVKQARAVRSHPDEWIFALVSLQTMSGYFGAGNPGISRMNSGFGNRSIVELIRHRRPGARWRDAVVRLLPHRRDVLNGPWGYDPDGLVLVWTEPWDGKTSLPLSRLDPLYVEICRRVRLTGDHGITHAVSVTSKHNRIAAKELKGVVGDAWLPLDLSGADSDDPAAGKALTVSPRGLTSELLRRLVFADGMRLSHLQKPLDSWQDHLYLSVSVLVRGQGTTDGFHERLIEIPAPVRRRVFGPATQRNPLALLSKTAVEFAGTMEHWVLRPAILTYLNGGSDQPGTSRDASQAWWTGFAARFEALWSDDFFPWLWSVPDPFDEEAELRRWVLQLRGHALTVLREAEHAMPNRVGRRYRARVKAEGVFWAALHQNFPFLKGDRHERSAEV